MEPNKPVEDQDDERKTSIKFAMGCFLLIVLGMAVLVISIITMYIRSISTGSKEFFVQ